MAIMLKILILFEITRKNKISNLLKIFIKPNRNYI